MSLVVISIAEVSMNQIALWIVSLQITGQPNEPSLLVVKDVSDVFSILMNEKQGKIASYFVI